MPGTVMPDVDCFFDFNEAASFLDAIAPSAPSPNSNHSGLTLSPESTHSNSALPFQQAGWSPYANPYGADPNGIPEYSGQDIIVPQSQTHTYDRPSSASNSLRALFHSNSSVPTSPDLLTKNPVKQEFDMTQDLDMQFDDYAGLEDLSRQNSHALSTASGRSGRVSKPRGKDKTNHNLIEKKYRTNINAKILMLRDAVPTLRFAAGAANGDSSVAALEGLSPASKLNKASIFTKATEYIQHLEQKVEYLSAKNQELHSMLNAATAATTSSHHNTPMLSMALHTNLPYPTLNQPRNQPQFVDLSYNPQDTPYGHTPMQQSFSGNSVLSAGMHGDAHGQDFRGSKLLMGGMAAVMTTSLFGGQNQNDVRGLGALPFANFLPLVLTLDAPLLSHFVGVLKACLVLTAFYAIFEPYVTSWLLPKLQKLQPVETRSALTISKTWLLVALRLHVPQPLSEEARASILAQLNGDQPPSYNSFQTLLIDYMVLLASADSFETSFLTLILSKLLLVECPFLAFFLNHSMSVKGRLLLNLEYKGNNKSLASIKRLIADVDDLAWLASPSLTQRLHNLATRRALNYNVAEDCREHQRYLQVRQQSRGDYYRTWRDWRVLEVAASLNAVGLESNDKLAECVEDLRKLSAVIDANCPIKLYVELVAALADPKTAGIAVRAIQARIERELLAFKLATEGPDLTDGELSADDESLDAKLLDDATHGSSDTSDDSDADVAETIIEQDTKYSAKVGSTNKCLVSSLSLVSVEEYLVCASTLILQLHQQGKSADARQLLKNLRLTGDTPILFLGFTSLVRLVQGLVPGIETPVLETCAVSAMSFLRDPSMRECISSAGRASLSKDLLTKCKSINGIDELV